MLLVLISHQDYYASTHLHRKRNDDTYTARRYGDLTTTEITEPAPLQSQLELSVPRERWTTVQYYSGREWIATSRIVTCE